MKRLLALSGGGMRGLPEAALLEDMERRTGKRCCEIFDHISGTSIGGIVAALLAVGMPANQAVKFFIQDGPNIFKKHWWRSFGLFCPRYPAAPIERVLQARLAGLAVRRRPWIGVRSRDGLRGDARVHPTEVGVDQRRRPAP